jgi:hypothetical protein
MLWIVGNRTKIPNAQTSDDLLYLASVNTSKALQRIGSSPPIYQPQIGYQTTSDKYTIVNPIPQKIGNRKSEIHPRILLVHNR